MEYVRGLIWDLAMELTFDCFFAGNAFPVPQKNHVAQRLKDSSALMVSHVENTLAVGGGFQTALHFLDDVDLQLQIARGLGFMDGKKIDRLNRMVLSLERLMGRSR